MTSKIFRDINSGDSNNGNNSGYIPLLLKLRELEFEAFQQCVVLWLGAKGYKHMRSLGRWAARGRRTIGGADLIAEMPGEEKLPVVIQIRHWRTPVQRRAVDELWGYMLRHGIPNGMIVTKGWFSKRAFEAINEFPGRPIRLYSGPKLVGSMASLGLGIIKISGHLRIDEAFFRTLNQLSFASTLRRLQISGGVSDSRAPKAMALAGIVGVRHEGPRDPNWLVAVALALIGFLVWLLWLSLGGNR